MEALICTMAVVAHGSEMQAQDIVWTQCMILGASAWCGRHYPAMHAIWFARALQPLVQVLSVF